MVKTMVSGVDFPQQSNPVNIEPIRLYKLEFYHHIIGLLLG